jgi:HNH endonuclease
MESLPNDRSWSLTRRQAYLVLWDIRQCSYCGETGTAEQGPDGHTWQFDHVIPRARGGTNDPQNIVKACRTCNIQKGASLENCWKPNADTMTAAGVPYGGRDDLIAELRAFKRQYQQNVEELDSVIGQLNDALAYIDLLEVRVQAGERLRETMETIINSREEIERVLSGFQGHEMSLSCKRKRWCKK